MKGRQGGSLGLAALVVAVCAVCLSWPVRFPSAAAAGARVSSSTPDAVRIAAEAGIVSSLQVSASITSTTNSVQLLNGAEPQAGSDRLPLPRLLQPRFVQVRQLTLLIVERIPYEIEYQPEQSAVRGRVVVCKAGTGGERQRLFRLTYEDGSLTSVVPVSDVRVETAGGEATAAGTSAYRGGATKELYVEATAYTPTVQETDSDPWTTASGMKSGLGVVAVDPKVIPLGSKLYIEGYGYAIAGDTGGAIKGARIDVFFYSHDEMVNWGRRWVRVFVLP